jgi:hypothetical protein
MRRWWMTILGALACGLWATPSGATRAAARREAASDNTENMTTGHFYFLLTPGNQG